MQRRVGFSGDQCQLSVAQWYLIGQKPRYRSIQLYDFKDMNEFMIWHHVLTLLRIVRPAVTFERQNNRPSSATRYKIAFSRPDVANSACDHFISI
jgi:hypothetical protein